MKLVYTPQAGDPDTTVVNGITFAANSPVDVEQDWLAEKLSSNPWFTKYEPPPAVDTAAVEGEIAKLKAQLAKDEALLSH